MNVPYYFKEGITDLTKANYSSALQRFNSIIDIKPQSWESFYLRGIAKFYLNDYLGVRADFEKGITINPYFSELHLYNGITYQVFNDYSTALKCFDKAQIYDPMMNPSNPWYSAYTGAVEGTTLQRLGGGSSKSCRLRVYNSYTEETSDWFEFVLLGVP